MLLMSSSRPKTGEHSGHKGLNHGFKLGGGLILSKIFVDMSSVFDPGFFLITYSCELVSNLNHPEVV